MSKASNGKIGFWAVVSIGVGGMVGGGIFAVLGIVIAGLNLLSAGVIGKAEDWIVGLAAVRCLLELHPEEDEKCRKYTSGKASS